MSRGDEPAFPTNRAGHSPEPGMSIRDYVEVEILAKLYAQMLKENGTIPLQWHVDRAVQCADAWLKNREKRNGIANHNG